jgi:hypothetical protein
MKHSVRLVTDEHASLSCFKKVQASVAWVNITAPGIYLEEGGAYREHLAYSTQSVLQPNTLAHCVSKKIYKGVP